MNQYKAFFLNQYKNFRDSKEIFISFGEIDCRKREGIIPHSIKYNKDISKLYKQTINGYLNYMEEHLSKVYSKRYYFGVPAPRINEKLKDKSDVIRKLLIKEYNIYLKKEVLLRGSSFIDVYKLTANQNGENNDLYMCDETHLSPKCLSILFRNHLFEPNI